MTPKCFFWMVFPLALLASCTQQSASTRTANPPLGTLELPIGENAPLLSTQGLITSGFAITRKLSGGVLDSASGLRHIWSTFEFQNTGTTTWDNLTMYAYNQAANNVGGTAFKLITNSDNVALTSPEIAQSIRPSHAMVASGNGFVVNSAEADYQIFRTAEAQTFQTAAQQGGAITANDQILNFGYVLRNSTGGRQVAPNEFGQVTFAFLMPIRNPTTDTPGKFSITLQLSNETVTRVSRSAEETTSAVIARGNTVNASEIAFSGLDGDEAPTPKTTVRQVRVKTNTAPDPLGDQIQQNIDAAITGLERDYIAEHMRDLPSSQWNEVIFATGNAIYVNRVNLRGLYQFGVPLAGGLYRDPVTNDVYASASSSATTLNAGRVRPQATTTCSSNSGPFRRVVTSPGVQNPASVFDIARFGFSSATISPPILATDPNQAGSNGTVVETGYVYFGGVTADMGLQYSFARNNWALYGKTDAVSKPITLTPRLSATDSVNLTFSVIGENRVRIEASQGAVAPKPIELFAPGFSSNGAGNRLKRLTTIAQRDTTTGQDVNVSGTGSRFAVLWDNMRLAARNGTPPPGFHGWGTSAADAAIDCKTSANVSIIATGSFSEEIEISN
jgi:hypothetical protein